MKLLPCLLEKTWHFLENLDTYARTGEEFRLADLCVNLTFDIIGAVTMDLNFCAQLDRSHHSEFIQLYRQLAQYCNENYGYTLPWHWLGMKIRQHRVARRLDSLIKQLVRQRFTELRDSSDKEQPRSILAISLCNTPKLTPLVLEQICDQLKTFMFAGHDTTSIVLQWAFYEISRTPSVLAKLRAELDGIFGDDPDPTIVREALLKKGEDLFQHMKYTNAVIKETLRLYPPAGTARTAPMGSGTMVYVPGIGERCIDGLVVYNSARIIQRDRSVYGPSASEFIPERWLENTQVGSVNSIKAPPSAWRPFERGPRNCIGQELANIEMRIILACTARRYEFRKVGQGGLMVDRVGRPILNEAGQFETESHLYNVSH